MKKKTSIFFILLLSFLYVHTSQAQYGREWIVPGQNYWKIPVAEKGIYAIPFASLSAAGVPMSDPTKLQVWFRGVEQSILVNASTAYFYGQGNDGTLDSLIYEPMNAQPNKFYSLFSDTTYYFVTVGSVNGKRLTSNVGVAGVAQNYHTQDITQVFTDQYTEGLLHSVETYYSAGDFGEGWVGPGIYQSGSTPNVSTQYNLPVTNLSGAISNAELEIVFVGLNTQTHRIQVLLGTNPNAPDATYTVPDFFGRTSATFKQSIPTSLLTNNQPLSIFIKLIGTVVVPDYISVAHVSLRYPQTMNVSSGTFATLYPVKDNQDKSMTIGGFSNGAQLWDITNEGAYTFVNYTFGGGNATFDLGATSKKLIYASAFKSIIGIQSVDVSPYATGSEMLLITHNKLMSSAIDYANYRQSITGGNMSVLLAEINKLYNLYSYGEKHPIAIKRFCKEQMDLGNPKYLFIIGKGVNLNYYGNTDSGGKYYRKDPQAFINNTYFDPAGANYRMEDLVPTYGFPASDLHFSITDNTYKAKLATGRLSARTDADVLQYLDKVRVTENLDSNQIWRKHLIHLSGGRNPGELTAFRNVVAGFTVIAESPVFGGKVVRSFSKDLSAGAVDSKLINSIADEMNKGVSYVTSYGHSSPNILDLDIGKVSNPVYGYNNVNKYPLLFANGCESAEFFLESSIPEDWIMTPKKGAVLAMGHAHIGYTNVLANYTSLFYKLNFNDVRYINYSIGDIHKKTIDSFVVLYGLQDINKAQVTQFGLQGDPSMKIYKPSKTDYAISGDNEVGERKSFLKSDDGKPITATSNSFSIAVPVINYGVTNAKTIQFKIKHYVSGALYKEYPLFTSSPVSYLDTLYFSVAANSEKLFGLNRFEITLDPNDSIPEFNESNNIATIEYFFPLSSVSCLIPQEYSVVYNQPVQFIAQSNDLLQGERDYYIEIDTSHLYNSPAKVVKIIKSGALIKFTQNLLTNVLPSDSIVYYWRVRFNDLPSGETPLWGESSFIYIRDSYPGWSQSEYPQFFKDTYSQIEMSSTGALTFSENTSRIYAFTQGNASGTSYSNVGIGVNDNGLISLVPGPGYCPAGDACYVVTFDKSTVLPYLLSPANACGTYLDPKVKIFYNLNSPSGQNTLKTFLQSVPVDDYILVMSSGSMYATTWDPTLNSVFVTDFGAQHINELTDKSPYILLVQQGAGTPISEVYSTDETATIELREDLIGRFNEGRITSTLIGPSSEWGTFYKTIYPTGNDSSNVSIIRFNPAGLAVDTIQIPQIGDIDLNPFIDANAFPYIKLLYYASDTVNLTPAYLKKWQVIYSPVPEGTLNPEKAGLAQYTISKKLNGEQFNLSFAFENISELDFPEPLKVVFTLRTDNGKIKRDTVQIGLLPKGQVTTFNYTVDTKDFYGHATFQVYVNPRFQRELYYNNNLLDLSFDVLEDKTNPIVDVMFDGVHIFDGDIVSPSPVISVSLNDNNPFLQFNDPSTLQVYLLRPGSSTPEQVDITNPDVIKWGEDPDRKGKYLVEYNPKNLPDGVYKLIVQGKDASGNKSGTQSYEIKFEVINASTITNFYPYPNPFSTSTRFIFTLTGSELPEDLKIQIMTVSGKVVREIMKHELGNIHIGNNITDYHWNGTDEFGDKLANGVYIYRVIIKNQNDNFEHRETAGDKAFKKGYGKLYILR